MTFRIEFIEVKGKQIRFFLFYNTLNDELNDKHTKIFTKCIHYGIFLILHEI